GVSSIHSAVRCVEVYGTVSEKDSFRVTSCSVIVQMFEFATSSAIDACMWSPGATVMFVIVTEVTGTSSHHAEYDGAPDASTSCSVPVWIRVEPPTVQPASTQPPPMPIQSDEFSAWPGVCAVTVGTVQSPVTELKSVPPRSTEPML